MPGVRRAASLVIVGALTWSACGDDGNELALTSGNIHTSHADFWNAWDQDKLDNEVARCINRDLVCGING